MDCGAEFINPEVAAWLQARDIAQSRSRPYQKNDQAHVESKNNHVVRKHAFYWSDDTPDELELLNELWRLVSLRPELLHPDEKARRLHQRRRWSPHAHLRPAGHPVATPAGTECA